jgi:hypothetical protein
MSIKITRKRVTRTKKINGGFHGPRVQTTITHNATVTGMDQFQRVLVLGVSDLDELDKSLQLLHSSKCVLGASAYELKRIELFRQRLVTVRLEALPPTDKKE